MDTPDMLAPVVLTYLDYNEWYLLNNIPDIINYNNMIIISSYKLTRIIKNKPINYKLLYRTYLSCIYYGKILKLTKTEMDNFIYESFNCLDNHNNIYNKIDYKLITKITGNIFYGKSYAMRTNIHLYNQKTFNERMNNYLKHISKLLDLIINY